MGSHGNSKPLGKHQQWTLLRPRVLATALLLCVLAFVSWTAVFSSASAAPRPGQQGWWPGSTAAAVAAAGDCRRPAGIPAAVADAVVHYAASNITPQQTRDEIGVALAVLKRRAPCKMLVFGLGFDSLMWATLNHGGTTVFLEEDHDWLSNVRARHPGIVAHHVRYPTMVSEAFDLLTQARAAPECAPAAARRLQFSSCRLALAGLPADVYRTQWDVIMIDAPRGYFPEAPGRMQAIYSSAVWALFRRPSAPADAEDADEGTDVFVHDMGRSVEDTFSKEFLCFHNRVAAEGRLWHFNIRPNPSASSFCEHPSSSSMNES